MNDEVLARPSHSGSSGSRGSPTPSCGISPVLECIFGVDILSNWQNSRNGSLNCEIRITMVGKAKWKPLELTLPREIANKKLYCILEELQRLVAPSRT